MRVWLFTLTILSVLRSLYIIIFRIVYLLRLMYVYTCFLDSSIFSYLLCIYIYIYTVQYLQTNDFANGDNAPSLKVSTCAARRHRHAIYIYNISNGNTYTHNTLRLIDHTSLRMCVCIYTVYIYICRQSVQSTAKLFNKEICDWWA